VNSAYCFFQSLNLFSKYKILGEDLREFTLFSVRSLAGWELAAKKQLNRVTPTSEAGLIAEKQLNG
jgi:hypothetical protein